MNNNNNAVVITPPRTPSNVNTSFNSTPNTPRSGTILTPEGLRRMRTMRVRFQDAGLVVARRLFNENKRPNAIEYSKNKKLQKANENKNNKNETIKWKNVSLKNMPQDPISLDNFKPGQKAVRINKMYLTPKSFRSLARTSMKNANNFNGNRVLFNNPMTRQKVRKGDIEFVVLQKQKTKK